MSPRNTRKDANLGDGGGRPSPLNGRDARSTLCPGKRTLAQLSGQITAKCSLLHYSTTPLLHYSITPPLPYPHSPLDFELKPRKLFASMGRADLGRLQETPGSPASPGTENAERQTCGFLPLPKSTRYFFSSDYRLPIPTTRLT